MRFSGSDNVGQVRISGAGRSFFVFPSLLHGMFAAWWSCAVCWDEQHSLASDFARTKGLHQGKCPLKAVGFFLKEEIQSVTAILYYVSSSRTQNISSFHS